MPEALQPSPELETALTAAAEAVYGPGSVDFEAAAIAVQELLRVSVTHAGTSAQQLALGTLLIDMHPMEIEDDATGPSETKDGGLPERIVVSEGQGHIVNEADLTRVATVLLGLRASAREAVMAYCALRFNEQTPSEGGELHVSRVARGVTETAAVTDTLTRVYSRRALVLIAEDPDEIFAVVRQAQDEGNAYEVMKLVETSHHRVPQERAMSLIGLGVLAAEELENTAQVMRFLYMQFEAALLRFNALYNATDADEEFERNREADALAGEMELFAEAFGREEEYALQQMHVLSGAAFARALLSQLPEARAAMAALHAVAEANGGIPAEIRDHLHIVEELIARNGHFDEPPADDASEPPPDEDDPTTRADWWRNN